jgi:hypothetical protein
MVRGHHPREVAWTRSTRSGRPYPVGHCDTGRIASLGGLPAGRPTISRCRKVCNRATGAHACLRYRRWHDRTRRGQVARAAPVREG